MKKFVSILVLVSIAAAFAQIKFGMSMRVRSELQNLNSTDADTQIYDKKTDLRFRPCVGYSINDNLFVKAVFEIGDIQFGTNPSADLGTDGINTETKNLYLDIKPNKDHKITIGLLPYKDPHGFIFNADVAGILWKGKFNKYSVDLGWFATFDENEDNISESTYSYGTTFFALGLDYKLNERITLGLSNYLVFDRSVYDQPDPSITVNTDEVSIFVAPRIVGDYGKIKFDAQFVVNNRYYDYDVVEGNADNFQTPHAPDKTGTGFSLKSSFVVDKKITIRANFLYRGCQTMYENFETFKQFYDTGLEIINQNPDGIDYKDPMDFDLFEELGIALPTILVDYKVKDNFILTGGLGVFMFDQNYGKVADTMYMGSEFDIKAKITLYDDLNIIPFFALFVPDVGYSRVMDLSNPDHPEDLIMKLGTTIKYSF
ncbi:MAG: hypothetical protein GQ534_08820 [Candidatus Delongbacteria bacterium]|nr:hypothetical protein [Candidatus Delongbacteria bacterium]